MKKEIKDYLLIGGGIISCILMRKITKQKELITEISAINNELEMKNRDLGRKLNNAYYHIGKLSSKK